MVKVLREAGKRLPLWGCVLVSLFLGVVAYYLASLLFSGLLKYVPKTGPAQLPFWVGLGE